MQRRRIERAIKLFGMQRHRPGSRGAQLVVRDDLLPPAQPRRQRFRRNHRLSGMPFQHRSGFPIHQSLRQRIQRAAFKNKLPVPCQHRRIGLRVPEDRGDPLKALLLALVEELRHAFAQFARLRDHVRRDRLEIDLVRPQLPAQMPARLFGCERIGALGLARIGAEPRFHAENFFDQTGTDVVHACPDHIQGFVGLGEHGVFPFAVGKIVVPLPVEAFAVGEPPVLAGCFDPLDAVAHIAHHPLQLVFSQGQCGFEHPAP